MSVVLGKSTGPERGQDLEAREESALQLSQQTCSAYGKLSTARLRFRGLGQESPPWSCPQWDPTVPQLCGVPLPPEAPHGPPAVRGAS